MESSLSDEGGCSELLNVDVGMEVRLLVRKQRKAGSDSLRCGICACTGEKNYFNFTSAEAQVIRQYLPLGVKSLHRLLPEE